MLDVALGGRLGAKLPDAARLEFGNAGGSRGPGPFRADKPAYPAFLGFIFGGGIDGWEDPPAPEARLDRPDEGWLELLELGGRDLRP